MRRSYSRQTCGEILFVCGYRDGRDDRYGLLLSPVLFRLVVPPLQSGMVGPYPVWGTWLASCLPLERTSSYSDLGL
jgi:hypothetical protein